MMKNNKSKVGLTIVVIVVLLGIFGISQYNGLAKEEQAVESQWSQVENVMQRRADLIPNLVNSVQGSMKPVPDCGEETYKGSGKLTGRKALVTGGDSGIGRAAAIAYAREGADVAINYLPFEESDAQEVKSLIEKAGRKAVLLPGDLKDETFTCQ